MFGAMLANSGIVLGLVLKQPIGCPITLLGLVVFVLGLYVIPPDERRHE